MAVARGGAARALVREGGIYTVAGVAQLASSAMVIPVVTRLLPPEQYGVVTAAVVVMQLVTTVVMFGAAPVVLREHFQGTAGPLRARELVGALSLLGLAGTAVAVASGPWWAGIFRDIPFGPELVVVTVAAWPAAVTSMTQTLLRAQRRPGALVATVAVRAGGGQVLGLVLAATWDRRALGYLVGLGTGAALSALVGVWLSRPRRPRRGIGRLLLLSAPIALPALPQTISMYLLNAVDRVFVERLASLVDVGRYQVAYAVGSLGLIVLSALNNGWQPILLAAAAEDAKQVFDETARLVARLAQTGTILLIAVAPFALEIAAPDSYDTDQLVPVVAVVALSALPYGFHLADMTGLLAAGRTVSLARATVVALVVNVALNLALIPPLGLLGAALATTASYGLLAVSVRLAARKLAVVTFSPRIYAVPVVLTVSVAAASMLVPGHGVGAAVRLAVVAVATIALVVLAKETFAGEKILDP